MSTQSCSSTSTAPAVISSGTKRRHESDREQSGVYKSEHSLDHNQFSKNVLESEPSVWQEYEVETATPSQDLYFESKEDEYEEFNPPQSKKRFTDCSLLAGNSQPPPQAWSQDPLFTCSQYTDTDRFLTSQKTTPPKVLNNHEPSVLHSVQSEETFGFNMDLEGKTSTQKSFKHLNSSQMDDVKENRTAPSPNSSSKHSFFYHVDPVSNHKWIQPTTASRRKCKQNHKEKTKRFFLKKPALVQQNGDVDEDSLAMLFTQDSEGFRVIAHRGLQTRSPLKNQTNVVTGRVKKAAYKSLGEEDEEDEMLFTQDSQGNMVIKHWRRGLPSFSCG